MRRLEIQTAHGLVPTPCFMPIATKGAVKTLSSEDLSALGAEMILSNTLHLLLRPGLEAMGELGGLHKLMNWNRALLTDSGGYQVFSLEPKILEEGVEFRSPIDGAKVALTPESSIEMQLAIGADILMQFDDVAAGTSSRERYEEAMERSLRWAKRCRESFSRLVTESFSAETQRLNDSATQRLLFGIVQGGTHMDLRERSAAALIELDFDGYAIGGLSVGEPRAEAFRIAKATAELLPQDKPRYFMGGGFPEEIVYYVSVGIDLFDCVLPTRNARHGTLFLWKGDPSVCVPRAFEAARSGASDIQIASELYTQVHITNEAFALDQNPVDFYGLFEHSKAYLRHLFMVQEPLALRLATLQNLRFYLRLMHELRRV